MRLPMYEVRFTIYDLENSASGAREAAKQMRTGCDEAVIGRGYKATGDIVRRCLTIYDIDSVRIA